MIIVASLLGGLGLICILSKRTFLGVLIGFQFQIFSASMILVFAGSMAAGDVSRSHLFAFFVTLGGVAQLIVGFALGVRILYIKKTGKMDELRTLRH